MSDKVILITGASRGIGAATATLAAAKGYAVCVNYCTNKAAADDVVSEIQKQGGRAMAVQADVGQEKEVLRLFEEIDSEFGAVTALVNNAGVLETQSRVESLSADRLQRVFQTNVFGTILCSREAIKRMSNKQDGEGGSIVNVSSVASRLGAAGEYVDYAASKGAVDSFTIGLSKEVAGDGIRVNAVRPGFIYTDIHASGGEPGRVDRVAGNLPMSRGGDPNEVAESILWLLSDEASFTTGTFIELAGGM